MVRRPYLVTANNKKEPNSLQTLQIRIIFNSHLGKKSSNTGTQSFFFFFQENQLLCEENLSWSYLCSTLALSHHSWYFLWFPTAFTLCCCTNTSKRGNAVMPTGIHLLGGRAWSIGARLGKFCTTTVPQSEARNQSQLVRHCFLSAQA